MPYINNWEKKGVYRKFEGEVTAAEVLRAVQEVEADERFDNICYVISDFLHISGAHFEKIEIVRLASIDKAAARTNPDINMAVVTTSLDIMNAVRIYSESLGETPYPTRVFPELAAAREWVNA